MGEDCCVVVVFVIEWQIEGFFVCLGVDNGKYWVEDFGFVDFYVFGYVVEQIFFYEEFIFIVLYGEVMFVDYEVCVFFDVLIYQFFDMGQGVFGD